MICMNDMNVQMICILHCTETSLHCQKYQIKKTQLMTYIAADYHARAENVLDSCWRDVQF